MGRSQRITAIPLDSALLLGCADHCLFSMQAFAVWGARNAFHGEVLCVIVQVLVYPLPGFQVWIGQDLCAFKSVGDFFTGFSGATSNKLQASIHNTV